MSGRSRREAEIAVIRRPQPRSTPHAVAGATERSLAGAMEVPIDQVIPDPRQPRQDWTHGEGKQRLEELAESIREFGVLQPLLVREDGTVSGGRQRYVIIAGGRRRAAAEMAGQTTLPVVVRGEEAARVRVMQLVENLQRQELSPLDEARAFQELMDLESLTPPGLATRLHISAQHVRDRLRVMADQVLADAVERRQISATAAREIGKLPNDEVMRFRQRVLAGERLQTNDVEAVRTRLVAEGVINPRLKRAPKKQTSFVPDTEQPDRHDVPEATATAVEERQGPSFGESAALSPGHEAPAATLFGPAQHEDAQKQTSFVPAPSTEWRQTPQAEATSPRATPAGTDPDTATRRVVDALDAALYGQLRATVTAELDAHAGTADAREWWWLVYERLRTRLHGTEDGTTPEA